jgi:ectoine hydroxylase-related dioxygenase (phytanoyl-CoA dioxygenase family)
MIARIKKSVRTIAVAANIVLIETYMLLRKAAYRVKGRRMTAGDDRDLARSLREDGYVVLENYFDKDQVAEICGAIDNCMLDRQGDYDHINRVSYYRRPQENQRWDGGVYRFYGAHEIHELIRFFRRDQRLKGIVEEAFSTEVSCAVTMVQENLPEGIETRGFHIDMYAPLECKAFLFLTDVDRDEQGPFTIIKGSHRRFWWRLFNYLSRGLRDAEPVTTVEHVGEDDLQNLVKVMVKRGSVVLSCQQAVHRGWAHDTDRRIALVNYYTAKMLGTTPEFDDDNRLGYRYENATFA